MLKNADFYAQVRLFTISVFESVHQVACLLDIDIMGNPIPIKNKKIRASSS